MYRQKKSRQTKTCGRLSVLLPSRAPGVRADARGGRCAGRRAGRARGFLGWWSSVLCAGRAFAVAVARGLLVRAGTNTTK